MNTRINLGLALLLLPFSATPAFGDATPHVPHGHPVYHFLERVESRALLSRRLPQSRPHTRTQVARWLTDLESAPLSRSDRGTLARIRAEFHTEPANATQWGHPLTADAIRYDDGFANVVVEPLLHQTVRMINGDQDQTVSATRVGLGIRGQIGNHFGFRLQHFEAREWSTLTRTSRSDIVALPIEDVQMKGQIVDFREARFQFLLANHWASLDFGKESFDWGPSHAQNLFLRSESPSFYYARFQVRYKGIRFSHFIGLLSARPDQIDSSRTTVDNGHVRTFLRLKRIVAHRLEISLGRRVVVAAQESVVFGDRGIEFAYLPPPTSLVAAQSYLSNTDNAVFGVDVSILTGFGTKSYVSFFVDDLKKFSPGAFANKIGAQIGVLSTDFLRVSDLNVRAEYTRVDPYVYTHNFGLNAYTHFDANLGHPIGPNSDQIAGSIDYRALHWLRLHADVRRVRAGENFVDEIGVVVNVGGDVSQGRRPTDPESKTFLDGQRFDHTTLTAGVTAEPARNLMLGVAYKWRRGCADRLPGLRRQILVDLQLNAF